MKLIVDVDMAYLATLIDSVNRYSKGHGALNYTYWAQACHQLVMYYDSVISNGVQHEC